MAEPVSSDLATCVADWVSARTRRATTPQLLFVSGAQGIGKSTALTQITAGSDGKIVALSLDDVYLTKAERMQLAREVHPLFATRGPPGTHDLGLLHRVLDDLLTPGPQSETLLPVFDKARDERAPRENWRKVCGRPDVVIVEGWLMGVSPDPSAPQAPALNAVEAEDAGGTWRAWQERCLAGEYARLWDRADGFLHLDAPGFETVLDWRMQQEEGNLGQPGQRLSDARAAWVARFIQHYERLTRRMLAGHRRPGAAIKVNPLREAVSLMQD